MKDNYWILFKIIEKNTYLWYKIIIKALVIYTKLQNEVKKW